MCGSCCSEPGWLKPADWDNIARRLGLTKEEVLNKYLIIDYLATQDGYSWVLAPVKVVDGVPLSEPGKRVPWKYAHSTGKCIFLKDNLCVLHPVKPSECQTYECEAIKHNLEMKDPNSLAKEILEVSNRNEIATLWQAFDLKKFIPDKYNKAHCIKNLELEQLLLKEYQEDFPDIDLIARLERQLD